MKKEYDFTNGERGKFYVENVQLRLPIYLEDDIQQFFVDLAEKKNENMSKLINNFIKANIQIYKTLL
uniref:CopG family transcriptional regulator n=1 Tax=Desulfobacca acetoxidans TaxID=60893 RepID=A0A7V4G6E4_9BACT